MTFFGRLVELSRDIVFVVDAENRVQYVSPGFTRGLGWLGSDVIRRPALSLLPATSVDVFHAVFRSVLDAPGAEAELELQMTRSDGSIGWVQGRVVNLVHDESVGGVVVMVQDIDHTRMFEEQLINYSFYDALTGLPGRALFMDRLEQQLNLSRLELIVKVLVVRIDDFSSLQEREGWKRCEQVTAEMARRLAEILPADAVLGRQNSHTFMIAMSSNHSNRGETVVRIRQEMSRPFPIDDRQLRLTASVGLATATQGQVAAAALVDRADAATREAKRTGPGQAVAWHDDMNTRAGLRESTRRDLQLAVDRDQLRLHFQPIVDAQSRVVVGVEALVRWDHPQRGLIPPSEFIAIADETGLIQAIGRWVIETSLRQVADLNSRRARPLFVAVNISRRQLAAASFVGDVRAALSRSGMAPHLVQFDIDEATLSNSGSLIGAQLREIRKLAIGVAIDDFGTGYTSLLALKDAPATHVKLDRSFISELSIAGSGLVGGIIGLANEMGFATIAEGVETMDQFDELRRLGCGFTQGWLHARPMPFDDLVALLATGSMTGGAGGVAAQ